MHGGRGQQCFKPNSAPSHQDCAIVVALPLMSCTHMVQYLQLGLLHRTKVDLAARADPRARGHHGARQFASWPEWDPLIKGFLILSCGRSANPISCTTWSFSDLLLCLGIGDPSTQKRRRQAPVVAADLLSDGRVRHRHRRQRCNASGIVGFGSGVG